MGRLRCLAGGGGGRLEAGMRKVALLIGLALLPALAAMDRLRVRPPAPPLPPSSRGEDLLCFARGGSPFRVHFLGGGAASRAVFSRPGLEGGEGSAVLVPLEAMRKAVLEGTPGPGEWEPLRAQLAGDARAFLEQGGFLRPCRAARGRALVFAGGRLGRGVETWIALFNTGPTDVPFSVSFLTPEGSIRPRALRGRVLGSGKGVVFRAGEWVPEEPDLSVVVESEGGNLSGEAFVVDRGVWYALPGGEESDGWVFPPDLSPPQSLLLANPGPDEARVQVIFFGPEGDSRPPELGEVALPPGSTASLDLSSAGRPGPVGVGVVGDGAIFAALRRRDVLPPGPGVPLPASFLDPTVAPSPGEGGLLSTLPPGARVGAVNPSPVAEAGVELEFLGGGQILLAKTERLLPGRTVLVEPPPGAEAVRARLRGVGVVAGVVAREGTVGLSFPKRPLFLVKELGGLEYRGEP